MYYVIDLDGLSGCLSVLEAYNAQLVIVNGRFAIVIEHVQC